MKKKALRKDFLMEIRTTLNRFLSIFFIVAMGVAFFSGIRASEPDMRMSGDAYFDTHELMDLKVLSTLGLTDNDLEAIKAVEGVEKAEPAYMTDVLCEVDGDEKVVHMESIPEMLNKLEVHEGRMPEKADECIVDNRWMESQGFKIGDKMTFKTGSDKALSDTLNTSDFTIVGTCSSPLYISFDRGNTTIGKGEIDTFVYVLPDSFSQEVYSEVWLSVAGAKGETAFTSGYTSVVDEVKARVEGIEDVRCEARYKEIMDEADEELSEAESELESAKTEAGEQLESAREELESGQEELESGQEELTEKSDELEDAKGTLYTSRTTLDDGWNQYFSGVQQVKDNKALLEQKQAEFDAGEAQANAELESAEAQLNAAESEYEKNKAEQESILESKEAELEAQRPGYEQAKAFYESDKGGKADYDSQKVLYDTNLAIFEEQSAALDGMKTRLAELDATIQDGTATSEEIAEADTLRTNIAQTEPALTAAKAQLDETKAVLDTWENQLAATKEGIEQFEQGEQALAEGRQNLEAGLQGTRKDLDDGWAAYETNKQTVTQKMNEARQRLDSGRQQLTDAQNQLEASKAQLDAGELTLSDGWTSIYNGEGQIAEGWQTIEDNKKKLEDGWKEYEDAKKEAESKISDGEIKIQDAKSEIEGIERPEWYVNDRDSYSDYTGYGDNADRMRAIGEVFPVLFFLVAALISLTTMTRMVEEERTQIGTLKALGYSRMSIMSKYLGYAFIATLTGSIAGVLIGQKIFPFIIVTAYKIMYPYVPDVVIPYHLSYTLMAGGAALICTMAATLFSCYRELIAYPAELMRPVAPKTGRRVFMERIPFLWKRLSFTWKSTIRNLMRYKKRFFMTIFGIGGCMALMIVGYGLKDSIFDVAHLQYNKIQLYDAMAVLDDEAEDSKISQVEKELSQDKNIYGYNEGYMKRVTLTHESSDMDVYLYVPSTLDNLSEYITFNHRTTKKTFELNDDGAVITEKAAKELGVSKGDTVNVKINDTQSISVEVTDICENYLEHYLYISPGLYKKLAGEALEPNSILIRMQEDKEAELESTCEVLLKNDAVLTVNYTQSLEQRLRDMLETLNGIIVILIVSAGMLAFVVLYNLNNININERQRELATLKVLGFYDNEVSAYVYRENVLLTLIGVILGLGMGKVLHQFVIQTVEIDICMFGRNIEPKSYIYSILFTFVFSLLVNVAMHFKLKKIDMVESLKSVE